EGAKHAPALDAAADELDDRISGIPGVIVERKRFAVAVHYRLVADDEFPRVRDAVEDVAARHPELRRTGGKKVFELR
ncbi:MAG: trehalose-phosphatase, partial [Acidobacteria bacterium]|nr:trehalose-phosphatase [Acidobacteriota bacterium]NIQ86141.1 trehalose-phosphatase [Acidobacteriota bacterium]